MIAVRLHGPRDLRMEDAEAPEPRWGEVSIRVKRVGICGSDLEYFEHGRCGDFVPVEPFVLGHELVAEVSAVGEGVRDLAPGDRVGVDPSVACGDCVHCRAGRRNLCPDLRFLGSASVTPHVNGGLQEFLVLPRNNLHRIPGHVSDSEAALLEPLSVALHAVVRAELRVMPRVLVTGGGTIGQLIASAARLMGAASVAVSDPVDARRDAARSRGFDALAPSDVASVDPFDTVFEASGSPHALRQAIEVAKRGATIVQVGTLPDKVELPANRIMSKELRVMGTLRFADEFAQAVALLDSGRLDVSGLVTREYPFEDTPKAFGEASSREQIKVQIVLA